ncbi:acyl carrier protein [Streptomyces sp. NPDC059003]|uniref:acyl carrier protein n=1 Tax=Streptomyces sp. NPDC059003 TaxID=3346691 RepID=UPI0036C34FF6
MDIAARVCDVLVDKFKIHSDRIAPDATLADLQMDSLAVVEFVLEVEDRFGVQIPEDTARTLTVSAVTHYITQRTPVPEPGP